MADFPVSPIVGQTFTAEDGTIWTWDGYSWRTDGYGGTGGSGVQGSQGIQGAQGFQGSQGAGAQGVQGRQGAQGVQGSQGAGSQGVQGVQGAVGNQGIQGAPGTGSQGVQGVQGSQGAQGTQGAPGTGSQGVQGVQGAQGVQGVQGSQGAGSQGVQGVQGAQGTQGTQGAPGTGSQGVQGIQGSQGVQGIQGSPGTGSQGVQGVQGAIGNQGIQGTSGVQGSPGVQGSQGVQGIQGAPGTGSQGVQGVQGAIGNQGIQGTAGAQGSQGVDGVQGSQGIQGTVGAQGSQGVQGVQGAQGVQGIQGSQGVQGRQGSQGIQGVQGSQGIQGRQGFPAGLTYTFSSTTYDGATDPGAGFFRLDDIVSAASLLAIDNIDALSGDRSAYLLQWANSTNTVKGVLTIFTGSNVTTFNIIGLSDKTGWVELNISGGTGSAISDQAVCSLVFSRAGDVGAQGVQGRQGSQGVQGVQGAQGVQGIQGAQGVQGIQGAQGIQGRQGAQGVQGIQGTIGAQGNQGIQGTIGVQGSIGNQGIQGTPGVQGAGGSPGVQGVQGTIGVQGVQGSQGIQGIQGSQGIQGTIGPIGGSTTQIMFNDAGTANGNANLTFNKTTNTLTVNSVVKVNIAGAEQFQIDSTGNVGIGIVQNRNTSALPGAKLHVIGPTILGGTPNLSAAVFSSNTYSVNVATGETTLTGLFFRPDGKKMYTYGALKDAIYEHDLSERWSIETAANVANSISTASFDSTPVDLYFRSDGKLVYIIGGVTDTIYELRLNEPWKVNTAVLGANSFNVESSASLTGVSLQGFWFKPSGDKFFWIDSTYDAVVECRMSEKWNLNTGYTISNTFNSTTNVDVSANAIVITSHPFNNGDSVVYVSSGTPIGGLTSNTLQYYATKLNADAIKLSTTRYVDGAPVANEVDITSAGTGTTDVIMKARRVSGEASPRSIVFSDDGSTYYYVGSNSDEVQFFHMSVPWEISSAVLGSSSINFGNSVIGTGATIQAMYIKPDLSRFFVVDQITDYVAYADLEPINQYITGNLTIAGDATVRQDLIVDGEFTSNSFFYNGTQLSTSFNTLNTTFGAVNTTFGTVNTTFGTLNTTFGTVNTTFGTTNTAINSAANTVRVSANSGSTLTKANGINFINTDSILVSVSSGVDGNANVALTTVNKELLYANAAANVEINSTTDVTVVQRDVPNVLAGDRVLVEGWFTLLNNSGTSIIPQFFLDFDGAFATTMRITGGTITASATAVNNFYLSAVLDVKSASAAFCQTHLRATPVAGTSSNTGQTMAATHLDGKVWGQTAADTTGTCTVTFKANSNNTTATQTLRLHSFNIRKVTP